MDAVVQVRVELAACAVDMQTAAMQAVIRVQLAVREALENAIALAGIDVSEELIQRRREVVPIVEGLFNLNGVLVGVPDRAVVAGKALG